MTALALPSSLELAALDSDVARYVDAAWAPATREAYGRDWAQFREWIEGHGLDALPADPRMVASYLARMARTWKASTVRRKATAIGVVHRLAGHPNPMDVPVVRAELRGIRRTLKVAPVRQAPLLIDHLQAIADVMPDNLRGVRDKAIILCGWGGALRRSEIAALSLEHLAFLEQGIRVLIPESKTDQEGSGEYVALFHATRKALCPVVALRAWLSAAAVTSGPVFRKLSQSRKSPRVLDSAITDHDVRYVVQSASRRAGIQAEQFGERFSAHSLRAGFITEAARHKRPEYAIAAQSRHKSAEVLRGYIRIASVFDGNAGDGLL